MDITKETLKNVARNSRLALTEEELEEFTPQLKEILTYFEQLKTVPETKPSIHPNKITNEWREDKEEPSLTQEEALANVKIHVKGYIKGPTTL